MSLTTTWPWQLIRSNLIRKTRWRRSATLCWRQRHESTLSTSISAPKLIGYEIRHLLLCCIPLQLYLCAVSCPPPPAIHFDPISGLSSATPPQHMAFNLLLRPGIRKSSSHFRQPWTLRFFCRSAVRSWDLLSSPHSIKSQPRHSLASQWKFRKWLITSRCSPLCTLSLSAHDDAKCHTVDAPWHFNILHLNPICILNVQPPLFSSSYAPRVCDLMALHFAASSPHTLIIELKWNGIIIILLLQWRLWFPFNWIYRELLWSSPGIRNAQRHSHRERTENKTTLFQVHCNSIYKSHSQCWTCSVLWFGHSVHSLPPTHMHCTLHEEKYKLWEDYFVAVSF